MTEIPTESTTEPSCNKLLQTLPPKERSILQLIKGLADRETQKPQRISIGFRGHTASEVLQQALESDGRSLPVPIIGAYIPFQWVEIDEHNQIIVGSSDVRLIADPSFGADTALRIMSNVGTFGKETREVLTQILGDSEYPVWANDRSGFRWENKSYTNAKNQRSING